MTTGCNNWRGHRWTRWGAPERRQSLKREDAWEFTQKRECDRCGMVQYFSVPRLFNEDSGQ